VNRQLKQRAKYRSLPAQTLEPNDRLAGLFDHRL
jgi:hypothetical protein